MEYLNKDTEPQIKNYKNTDIVTDSLIVNGESVTPERLRCIAENTDDEYLRQYIFDLADFYAEWLGPNKTITLTTSGSTGKPKNIHVSRKSMIDSALLTCNYFKLRPGQTALLCMPMRYVAARMMVVRAIVRGLNLMLVPPTSHPLAGIFSHIDFAAMVPIQVAGALTNSFEIACLEHIDKLIIGGAPVDDAMARRLRRMKNKIYATYGMTETLSHIALRRLSGEGASKWFYPLNGIKLTTGINGNLKIYAPHIGKGFICTHDLVRFAHDGGFQIIGRTDNIINSGGIKIPAEELERLLSPNIPVTFAVTSIPDATLGNAVVLLLHTDRVPSLEYAFSKLPQYWVPRHVLCVSSIPSTPNGKIDRPGCRELAARKLAK